MNDLSTSVTEIKGILIVSLAREMTDSDITKMSELLNEKAYQDNIRGAILNFSMVTVLDLYMFAAFEKITETLALMGVQTVWVGLSPGVVAALMDLCLETDVSKMHTAINLEHGLEMLSHIDKNAEKAGAHEIRSDGVHP